MASGGTLEITPNFDAPFACSAATAGSGGSWAADASDPGYSFLIVAWDDPREEDWHRARFRNRTMFGTIGGGPYYSMVNDVQTAANDIVTLYWTPPRRRPHHYTVYFQSSVASFAFSTRGKKIRPSSGTTQALEIPGWATSAVFANGTEVTENRIAIIRSTVTNTYYEVAGNHAISLGNGNNYNIYPAASAATWNDTPQVLFSGNEERTRGIEGSTTAAQTHLSYVHGPIYLQSAVASSSTLTLSLLTDMPIVRRESIGTDFTGRAVELAYVNDCDPQTITLECTMGGTSIGVVDAWATGARAEAFALLHKYRRFKIPLCIKYTAAGTEMYSGLAYYGIIEDVSPVGYTNVQSDVRIRIQFKVESVEYELNDRPAYAINTATVGSGGTKTITINGDHQAEFITGTKFEIVGSTGNDGMYVCSSNSDITAGVTGVYVYPAIVDGTDDGYIRIWDQP